MKIISVVLCCVVLVASVPQRSYNLLPEQRNEIIVNGQPIPYEYQIVPSSEYAVAPYQSQDYSILDYVLSPVTALVSVGSTAISAIAWLVTKGGLVLLGMSIVIGLCGFTTFCDITIANPFSEGISVPYLDDMHYYFNQAYHKYHALQNWK